MLFIRIFLYNKPKWKKPQKKNICTGKDLNILTRRINFFLEWNKQPPPTYGKNRQNILHSFIKMNQRLILYVIDLHKHLQEKWTVFFSSIFSFICKCLIANISNYVCVKGYIMYYNKNDYKNLYLCIWK